MWCLIDEGRENAEAGPRMLFKLKEYLTKKYLITRSNYLKRQYMPNGGHCECLQDCLQRARRVLRNDEQGQA